MITIRMTKYKNTKITKCKIQYMHNKNTAVDDLRCKDITWTYIENDDTTVSDYIFDDISDLHTSDNIDIVQGQQY